MLGKNFFGKMKPKKKDDLEQVSGLLNKKLRILNDGMNIVKVGNTEKNARENFACGACGQCVLLDIVPYSFSKPKNKDRLGLDGKKIESESNDLLPSIENMQYAVTLDVVNICLDSYCSQGSIGWTLQYRYYVKVHRFKVLE
uniref:Uncharacterized protein n=1 Tax=Lactuca sativa TaxID=4236 RepID=A0A9R1V1J0_LACSA|nr:hypothetical protein LSAT_V11C700368200 [Lactuca sativa]